jgi:hypothetical protein
MTRVATLGVLIRIVLAMALPAVGFWLKAVPMPSEYDFGVAHYAAATLDLPVSGMNWILPESFRTHLSMYRPCDHTYCFPDSPTVETFRYVRVGFPAYLALLFLPGIGVRAARRSSGQHGSNVPPN